MKYLAMICATVLLVAAMKYYSPIAEKQVDAYILTQLAQLKKNLQLNKLEKL